MTCSSASVKPVSTKNAFAGSNASARRARSEASEGLSSTSHATPGAPSVSSFSSSSSSSLAPTSPKKLANEPSTAFSTRHARQTSDGIERIATRLVRVTYVATWRHADGPSDTTTGSLGPNQRPVRSTPPGPPPPFPPKSHSRLGPNVASIVVWRAVFGERPPPDEDTDGYSLTGYSLTGDQSPPDRPSPASASSRRRVGDGGGSHARIFDVSSSPGRAWQPTSPPRTTRTNGSESPSRATTMPA